MSDPHFEEFCEGLTTVCTTLAKAIVRDGEGATRMLEVRVEGAAFPQDARRIARAVATSSLVKTALAGASPNWGRIVAAVGAAHSKAKVEKVDIAIGGMPVFAVGMGLDVPDARLREVMSGEEVLGQIRLHQGSCSTTYWGCDLTEKYVKINKLYI